MEPRAEVTPRPLLQLVPRDTMEELERNRTTIKRNIDRAKHANAQMTTAESITYKMKHWWRNL